MRVKGDFHHIGISVEDLDKSVEFYTKVLDFEIVWLKEGLPIGDIVGLPGAYAKQAMIKGYGVHLELFEYVKPKGERKSPNRQCDRGLIHIALMVDDIHQAYRHLLKNGLTFNTEPHEVRPGSIVCYAQAPDDVVLELLHWD